MQKVHTIKHLRAIPPFGKLLVLRDVWIGEILTSRAIVYATKNSDFGFWLVSGITGTKVNNTITFEEFLNFKEEQWFTFADQYLPSFTVLTKLSPKPSHATSPTMTTSDQIPPPPYTATFPIVTAV